MKVTKEYVACGKTLGHGETCVVGHLCDSCQERDTFLKRIKYLEDELTKVNNEFGCATADWPDAWKRVAEIKKQSRQYYAEIQKREGQIVPTYASAI